MFMSCWSYHHCQFQTCKHRSRQHTSCERNFKNVRIITKTIMKTKCPLKSVVQGY